ncbi:hypothetical protein RclHR1_11060005 [Rhizophagus clarus]|uniref:F-box domain-containing protein n=1 Tax=Rhizophagus clarus TaxID=94130 RepID=A0A2Z6Q3H4_9GLOM|nr:hypothetical protein RclHR1_11060005 [Rhizophagus clarus]GES88058.1 hypothetical protein GLOIN_2v1784405 [Rhizophagus clarus]
MSKLPDDCLNEIFECLDDDKVTLYSCLLVNRLWCQVSVRILWRNIGTSNFNTLIECLSKESKKILNDNGIRISTPTSKFPTFNYVTFCKTLSVNEISYKVEEFLKIQQIINNKHMMIEEIFKMFMNQISSLKSLEFLRNININFILYPGAKDSLKNLSELHCSSSISSEFFCQLTQISHNLLLLDIKIEDCISDGIEDLISSQKNLKSFYITLNNYDLTDTVLNNLVLLLMTKLPKTLIRLIFCGRMRSIPLSFIKNFTNLQELQLSFDYTKCFLDFEKLQYANLPQLQILKIQHACPRYEFLIKFIENNGKNLKELYMGDIRGHSDNLLNLAIAEFCPNLRKLSTGFKDDELETLKIILNNCKYLERIKIWCGSEYLSEKEALEIIAKYSQENISELILYHQDCIQSEELLPDELDSFFTSWMNRMPQKSLSLEIVKCDNDVSLDTNHENMRLIEKYTKLGFIKNFKITDFDYYEYQ